MTTDSEVARYFRSFDEDSRLWMVASKLATGAQWLLLACSAAEAPGYAVAKVNGLLRSPVSVGFIYIIDRKLEIKNQST